MNQIKNIHQLTDLPAKDVDKMEQAALMHRRHSGILFKIVAYDDKKITIQVVQEKNAAENYHPAKRLVEIVHETFDRFFEGKKVIVNPIPFNDSPVNKVNQKWIEDKMLKLKIKLKDISSETGINYSQLSALITGKRPLSQPMKALFYFYFNFKG